MFNLAAPYRHLIPTMYLFTAGIANPDLFVCGCRTWTHFSEEQRQPFSGSAWPAGPKNGKSGYHCWCFNTMIAPPLVGCVVSSRKILFNMFFTDFDMYNYQFNVYTCFNYYILLNSFHLNLQTVNVLNVNTKESIV